MRRILLTGVALATVLPLVFAGNVQPASGKSYKLTNRVAPVGVSSLDIQNRVAVPRGLEPFRPHIVPSVNSGGCSDSSATNVRANQDCTNQSSTGLFGRGEAQNETAAAVNPLNPQNVLLSQNDYRNGDASCAADWSTDGGAHWGSVKLPTGFIAPGLVLGRRYWDASGDTSVAFDSTGEAYLLCGPFMRLGTGDTSDNASAILLFRSADGGASWSFDGSIVAETLGDGSDGIGLLDKIYMVIDTNANSPYRDRIHVVWAQYDANFTQSPTYYSYSDDHGNSWSTPKEISGKSQDLCPITFSSRTDFSCDESQFNNPFVAPNGDVYDVFINTNNCAGALRALGFDCPNGEDGDNHNQILIVKSTDGGDTWGDPVKVGNYYELPDCYTYTGYDFGRACVPTAPLSDTSIFRATNYPVGVAVSDQIIVVNYGSYINRHSNQNHGNCTPAGISLDTFLNLYDGVGDVGGCNNDIVHSVSNNGGQKFTGTHTGVTHLPSCSLELGREFTDQWWQWTALDNSGRAVSSYYDRSYGNDQATGYMDFTLVVGSSATRVTDFSMPPSNEFPDVNGYSVFMGDYTGLAIGSDNVAHPVWTDTRNGLYTFDDTPGADPRVLTFAGQDEDVYTAAINLNTTRK
jgi:hypothetical protein